MAGKRDVFRKIPFPKLGKRDRQVKPIICDGNGAIESSELKTISKQVEGKRTEREIKRMKKAEEHRMEAIEKDNKRMKKRMLRKQVRKDIVQTTSESCATFCFVFVVGSTLLGGGTALIISGRENNVFDFVVVGATGLVCGVIFTVTGVVLFMKPLWDRHKIRKDAEYLEAWGNQKDKSKEPTKPYIDQFQESELKSQIKDEKRQRRRPSNVELYGDEASFDTVNILTTPRDDSFSSYTNPPFLVVPNNEKESFKKKPVLLLDAKETKSYPEEDNGAALPMTFSGITKKSKFTPFSQEKDVGLDRDARDDTQQNQSKNISNLDKILKQPSRNTIVIDYSLLAELDEDTISVERFNTSEKHQPGVVMNQMYSRHYEEYAEGISEFSCEHPKVSVNDKHKLRHGHKHKKHSDIKDQRFNSHSGITFPVDDSFSSDV